jgi:site-specific DNA-cytosine methylase
MGYHRAGFDVIGVDINPQPNYPFMFVQHDALDFIANYGHKAVAIHASPPCQASTALTKGTNRASGWGGEHTDLIPQTRELLDASGKPYVIENVQGSSLRRDMTLCGEMFGLSVIRHRYFELSGFDSTPPQHVPHRGRVKGWRHGTYYDGPYFAVYGDGGGKGSVQEWQDAMGIHWTDVRAEIAEAIPPAYTHYIGAQLIEHLAAQEEGEAA